jgi:hypothetical protein
VRLAPGVAGEAEAGEIDADEERPERPAADPGGKALRDRGRAERGCGRVAAEQRRLQALGRGKASRPREPGDPVELGCEPRPECRAQRDDRVGVGREDPRKDDVRARSSRRRRQVAGVRGDANAQADAREVGGCGGPLSDPRGHACFDPTWSPDGRKLAFSLFDAATGERDIYTANADGTGLFQVTHGDSALLFEGDEAPSWGTHPIVR